MQRFTLGPGIFHREGFWSSAILHPPSQCIKDRSRLAAFPAGAMPEPGRLEVAKEVLDIRELILDRLVVEFGTLRRNALIGL